MKNRNPVKKNMDKFHKPSTHKDKSKYDRKSESEYMQDELEPIYHPTEYDESDDIEYAKRVESMIDEGGAVHPDSIDEKTPWQDSNFCYNNSMSLNYKFSEGELLQELESYIDNTYHQHYNTSKFQATEFIVDSGHGMGFSLGNILKYAQRYGKKNGCDKNDLLKVLHYGIIALHVHNLNNEESENNEN